MRDQASASGAEARVRAAPESALTRAETSAPANTPEASLGATVIAPHPGLWRRRRSREGGPIGGVAKRAFDIALASSALIILAPLLAAIWIAVRLERGGGDAIFKQERGGFGGKTFQIYKFRTMICAENGAQVRQVQAGDQRITPLGNFLRQVSWDELPQLFNVLRGEMSLIGPRPHALQHDRDFAAIDPSYPVRFLARPGITGLAQVSGCRGPTETEDKVRARTTYDVKYVSDWSFVNDLNIVLRTLLLAAKRDAGAI